MTEQTDLFGHPTGPAQASLFGEGDNRLQAPAQTFLPDPAVIRRRLNALLDKARGAQVMPGPNVTPACGKPSSRTWPTGCRMTKRASFASPSPARSSG